MTKENEPVYVRSVELTEKGRKALEALDKMLAELREEAQSSAPTTEREE